MFGGELISRRVGLCLLELKLQLVEQPRRADQRPEDRYDPRSEESLRGTRSGFGI